MERHEAIVVGAGPAGLATAALLSKRGFQTLVLERTDAVGARWRARYEGLRLNTMRTCSTLPGYRIPRRYGRYPRRDDFIAYLEAYSAHHRLSLRFETTLQRVERAGEDGLWRLETSTGPLLARYAVLATGYDAVPKLPAWANNDEFAGELIHASEYRSPEPYVGREVLVVGAGNTGIDIAGFLVEAGARVSLAMRTPPNVFPRDWHGVPLEPSAIPAEHLPAKIGDVLGFATQRLIYGDLSPYGIPRAPAGFQTNFRRPPRWPPEAPRRTRAPRHPPSLLRGVLRRSGRPDPGPAKTRTPDRAGGGGRPRAPALISYLADLPTYVVNS